MGPQSGYAKLQQLEEATISEPLQPSATRTQRPWTRFLIFTGKAVLFLFALIGLARVSEVSITTLYPQLLGSFHPYIKWGFIHTPHRRSCRCGDTLAEAIANGCHYDSHALAWLPPHCQDTQLLEEWETAGDGPGGSWLYYADKNGTQPLTIDEVAALGGKPIGEGWFWMAQEWHVKHCAFAWRKLARSPVTGVTVERSTSGLNHIAHCEKAFLMREDLRKVNTKAGVSLDADWYETRHSVEDDYWEIPADIGQLNN